MYFLGEYRSWEFMDTNRRWRSVDPVSAVRLNSSYNDGSGDDKITLNGTVFSVHFEDNIIKSEDGAHEYKV